MEYVAADGSRQRPIMVHRAIFGSLERFFGILIENYAGDFPLWLAPVQIRLLPVSDEQRDYATAIALQLKQLGYRVEVDQSGDRLGKQIRTAELEKIPVVAVIGKREVETQTLSVRTRQAGEIGSMTLSELQEKMQHAISNKQGASHFCSPHPKSLSQAGRGTLNPAPLRPPWEKRLGDEG